VQLVGRILRVHRRLQGRARIGTLPEELKFGYVFLADPETQTGIDVAGQRINAMQTEYAKASLATVALRIVEGASGVGKVDEAGQISFFGLERQEEVPTGLPEDRTDAGGMREAWPTEFDFGTFFGSGAAKSEGGQTAPARVAGSAGAHRYSLRAGMPRRFKTQIVPSQNDVTEDDCANRFIISTRELFEVMKNKIPVEKRTIEVFTHAVQQTFNFAAELSPTQAALSAQKALFRNKTFDSRELRRALLKKVGDVLREEAMSEADDPQKVAHFLNVILATHPELLHEAQKAALAKHAEVLDADELPTELISYEPLPRSPRNIYGIYPPGLNTWEQPFAELLDRDMNNVVNWWHRNESKQPWSVNVLMPDGRGFYPDFVIGIEGRSTELGTLLADPKLNFAREDEVPKILAQHGTYGKVMILSRDGARWMTVGYDDKARKPIIAREFRLADAAGF